MNIRDPLGDHQAQRSRDPDSCCPAANFPGKPAAFLLLILICGVTPSFVTAEELPSLVAGDIDEVGSMDPGDWIEMRDDGTGADGVAQDGVYTARVTFEASPTEARLMGYMVVPPGGSISEAVGLVQDGTTEAGPVPVTLPASDEPFTLEVRYVPNAPEGFGPEPSIADSWNTGFSLDSSLRRETEMMIVGSFQDLFGVAKWDTASEATILRDDGAFGDREPEDGIAGLAIVSAVGLGADGPDGWRAVLRVQEPDEDVIGLGASGWADFASGAGEDFLIDSDRWMPVRFEVDLLRGMARATEAPELLDLPMISQMSPLGTEGTYVDVLNTADAVLALKGIYLGDDRRYFLVPDPPNEICRAHDFNVTFPPGTWLAPSSTVTVTVTDDSAEFADRHGREPDYVVKIDPVEQHHMALAYQDSVRSTLRGLTNAGEYVVLYTWVEGMPLVEDLDVVVWGTPDESNLLPLKQGELLDGSPYGQDAGTVNEKRASGLSSGGLWRHDFRRKGLQRLFHCKAPCPVDADTYNGVFHPGAGGRYDATDQDLSAVFARQEAEPGSLVMLSLEGWIEDESGDPVSQAEVTVSRGSDIRSAETGVDGYFSLDIPHGTWRLSVSSFGFTTANRMVRIDHHKTLSQPVALYPATTKWMLSGAVKSADDGMAVPEANVSVSPGDSSTQTNEKGEFYMELIEGSYTLIAGATGFRPASKNVVLESNLQLELLLEPTEPPVSVSGFVECSLEGDPVPGVTVSLDDGAGTSRDDSTGDDGGFEIEDVPGGVTYSLTAEAPGYSSHHEQLSVGDEDIIGILIVLEPLPGQWTLSGTVFSEGDNEPVTDATVEAEGPGGSIRSVVTGSGGDYSFPMLATGSYEITASAPGYLPSSHTLVVDSDGDLDFFLEPTAPTLHSLTGTVALDDKPPGEWNGSTVTISGPEQHSMLTDELGAFAFTGLPSGTYEALVMRAGYADFSRSVTVTDDVTLEITLLPTGSDPGNGTGCSCATTGSSNHLALFLLAGMSILAALRRPPTPSLPAPRLAGP